MGKQQPDLYTRLGQPEGDERVSHEQQGVLASFLQTSPDDAVEKLLKAGDSYASTVKVELKWAKTGVQKAETNRPELYAKLGKPCENDRVSAVQISILEEALQKSAQDVIKLMLKSDDIIE